MKQIVLNIKESKYRFFMELIKSLDFVQVQDDANVTDAYNPEFVEKIMESKRQIAQGKFTEVKQEDLKSFIAGL